MALKFKLPFRSPIWFITNIRIHLNETDQSSLDLPMGHAHWNSVKASDAGVELAC